MGKSCHIYHTFIAAQAWDGVRAIGIMLNQLVRGTFLAGFSRQPPLFVRREHTTQFQILTENLIQLQEDVISSVSQYMGQKPEKSSAGTTGVENSRASGPSVEEASEHHCL